MHLFFAITKMGIGHALGEPLFDSWKSPSHPAAGEDDFAAARLRSSPGYDGREKPVLIQWATEFLNGTMLQRASICSESSLYDKLSVG